MNKQELKKICLDYLNTAKANRISSAVALAPHMADMRLYDEPLWGFASADDPSFLLMKDCSVVGDHFLLPKDWLSGAKTVISLFLPFTEQIKQSNRQTKIWPSDEWLHARFEGQMMINELSMHLQKALTSKGYLSVIPSLDKQFWSNTGYGPDHDDQLNSNKNQIFTSNWSERHVAYVCGLGTFGLSKGLLTMKGTAGRFTSLVTDLPLSPDTRPYSEPYEYCLKCGACIEQCPVNAISFAKGKDHQKCSAFLNKTTAKYEPRFGCGKCQVNVPCESRKP